MSRSFPQIFFNHLPWLRRCLNICNRRCAVSWFWPQHDLTKCTDSDGVLHPPLVLHYLQRGLDSSFQTSSSSTWGPLPFMQTFDLQRNLWNRLEAEMEVGELAKWSISWFLKGPLKICYPGLQANQNAHTNHLFNHQHPPLQTHPLLSITTATATTNHTMVSGSSGWQKRVCSIG